MNNFLTQKIFTILSKIGCIFSIITYFIDIFFYIQLKENRNFTFSTIIYLSTTNFIYSSAMLLPLTEKISPICLIQSFMIITFQTSQYLSSCLLCFNNFVNLIKKNHLDKHKLFYRIIFIILSLLIPLILSFLTLITKTYGDSEGYCWFDYKNIYKRQAMRKVTLTYFLVLMFVFSLNIFFIVKVHYIIKNNKSKRNRKTYIHINKYSIILQFSAIPGIIERIYGILNKEKESSILKFFRIIGENYIGIIINIFLLNSPWINDNFHFKRPRKIQSEQFLISQRESTISNENIN